MWEELDKFHDTLEEIEDVFFKVAAHSSELEAYGLRRLSRWFDLKNLHPALNRFPVELSSTQSIIGILDKPRSDALNDLLTETKLEDLIARFSVKLKIAEQERPELNPIYLLTSLIKIIFFRRNSSELFANSDVSLEAVLSAITRIKALIKIVSQDAKHRFDSDDEIFKPSNIDTNKITIEIDAAITILQSDPGLKQFERIRLIEYLQEAKDELSKKQPAWRKIVGALIITSTLLGGIAIAPQAAENINTAINYILGPSIEISNNDRLKLPEYKYKSDDNPQLPETYSI